VISKIVQEVNNIALKDQVKTPTTEQANMGFISEALYFCGG